MELLRAASAPERRIVMTVPDRHSPKLHRVMELVNADDDLYALWTAANVNAVERLGMTDHGPVHTTFSAASRRGSSTR